MADISSKKINSFLSKIEEELLQINYGKYPKELYDPIDYTMSMGGKRIRPLFVLLANDLFGGKIKDAISAAVAIEIFHNFTLVHDDIMDNAPLRRNKPTVFKKWNRDIALLSGDVMLVWAYRFLSGCEQNKFLKILEVFNDAAIKVCEGQQLDMNYEQTDHVTIPGYIEMISLKTAALIAASMKIGAVLGGSTEKDAELLFQFGKNIGIAFQLQDDLLDVFGDTKKFGKQTGGDIAANKKTFLLLKAFQRAGNEERKKLLQLFSSQKKNPSQKVSAVKEIYETLHIQQETEKAISHYFTLAEKQFALIRADRYKKQNLLSFVSRLMKRDN